MMEFGNVHAVPLPSTLHSEGSMTWLLCQGQMANKCGAKPTPRPHTPTSNQTNPSYGNGLHSPSFSSNTNTVPISNASSPNATSPTFTAEPTPPLINQTSETATDGNLRSHDSACFAA